MGARRFKAERAMHGTWRTENMSNKPSGAGMYRTRGLGSRTPLPERYARKFQLFFIEAVFVVPVDHDIT